jgi:hypothetical protein
MYTHSFDSGLFSLVCFVLLLLLLLLLMMMIQLLYEL